MFFLIPAMAPLFWTGVALNAGIAAAIFRQSILNDDQLKDLDRYLESHKHKIETKNVDGLTPLMCAAAEDKLQVVVALLKHGANPNAKSSPRHERIKAKQAHEFSSDDTIIELLRHFSYITKHNQEASKNNINWNEVYWVISKYPELLKAPISPNSQHSIAFCIASQPKSCQNDAGYQKVLALLSQRKLRKNLRASFDKVYVPVTILRNSWERTQTREKVDFISEAIKNNNLPLIKMLVKSEIDIERNTVWNGLASSDRSIHLYFKKIFDADKTKEYNCLGRMDDDQSALDRALFEALKKEANDSKSDKNVTSSQDLLSVGANPLSLLEKDAKRDDRIARTLFFKLGLISKEKWQSLKKEDDKRNEERSKRISNFGNAILGGLVFGTASSLALPLLGTMFIGSGLPTELLAYLGLALCIGIGCIAGCAMNALLNHITIKDKVKVNSDIPENVSSLSWHLASELSPHYANEVINSADLTQKAHEKMKKNAQKGYESHSSTEVHHLLIECIEEASSKVSAKDEAALLTKYKDTYKESFELTKKDKGATPADLPKKDRDLKDGTVNWAFELAQAHADKGHAQPKMESKHLKKLKIF